MDSDPLESADVAQDDPSVESPPSAEPSPDVAEPDDGATLDSAPDEDAVSDAPEPVILTKAQYDRLLAAERNQTEVQREKTQLAFDRAEAARIAEWNRVEMDFRKGLSGWLKDIDENGWTRDKQEKVNLWNEWRLKEHHRLKNDEIAEREAALDFVSRPNWARKLISDNDLNESQAKRVMTKAQQDPQGAAAMAEVCGEINADKARAKAKMGKATAKVVAQATKDHLDKQSAARIANQSDTLGGGGQPSVSLPFALGSDEHLMARLPGVFKPRR